MKTKLLEFLVCPYCSSDLKVINSKSVKGDIISGSLICVKCNDKFSIIDGIPRFLNKSKNYKTKESFSYEWDFYKYSDSQKKYYENQIIDFLKEDKSYFKDKMILEVGCGLGRQTQAIVPFCKDLFVLDISNSVDKLPKIVNLHPIQCDIMSIPLKAKSFDFIYSRGVFHHTPSTRQAFENSVKLVKNGGKMVFSIYPRRNFVFHSLNLFVRFFTVKFNHRFLFFLCKIMAPVVPVCYKLMNPDKNRPLEYWESVWLLFDWFSPKYQFHISENELDDYIKDYKLISSSRGYRKIFIS